MRTNLEKYKHYLGVIESKEQEYILYVIPNIPEVLYQVDVKGEISELKIEKAAYRTDKYFPLPKKPSKEQVNEVKLYSESEIEYKKERIFFIYEANLTKGTTTLNHTGIFLTPDEALNYSGAVRENIAHENQLLQNGHFRCKYCNKVTPDSEKVTSEIFGRAFNPFGKTVLTKNHYDFCSAKCAIHEQMSREG